MTIDPTRLGLVHTVPGAADVTVERGLSYATAAGPLPFDLYRPPGVDRPPVVVLVVGFPDPGAAAFFGAPFKDWVSYGDWGRAIAATGLAAVTYANREPADVTALLAHLRDHGAALGLDATRLGIWACSGHVPNALAVIARERPACAALLYGFFLDLDGATAVRDAAAQFRFAAPPVAVDELRGVPLLVVRAGADTTPGLEPTLQRFVGAARDRGLDLALHDLPTAPHSFDLLVPGPETGAAIDEVLAFLRRNL